MPKMKTINVGVIGVGWFGEFHARIYDYLAGSNLVGVYDLDQAKTKAVAESLNVRAYLSMDELLADDAIQAVSIVVKDQYHLNPVLAACQAGKHIMLEKPMALTLEECDQMIEAAKEARIKLTVGHLLRFNQRLVRAHAKIRAGEIGTIRHFYTRRNMPLTAPRHVGDCCGYHSMLYHGAVHDLDLLQWLADDEIVEAYAKYQAGQLESEGCNVSDTILTLLQFRNGAQAITEHSWIYPDNFPAMVDARIDVTGDHGRIELDLGFRGAISYTEQGVQYFENPHWPVVDGWYSSDLRDELESFIRCVAMDLPVSVTPEAAKKAIAVALSIEASLNSGKPERVQNEASGVITK